MGPNGPQNISTPVYHRHSALIYRENDLLFQIGDERVSMWPLSKVIQCLGEMEVTFTLVRTLH